MSRYDKGRELPPSSRIPRQFVGLPLIEEYGVGSWCPTPDGTGPAEAVVLHFLVKGLAEQPIELGIRLWSAAAVNELIAMLERHRNDVWPGGK